MRIVALNRGGCAAYGALYDPHRDEIVLEVRDGESRAITIEYPSAPTNVSTSGSGATATEPTISGNKVLLTLSAFNAFGNIDILATVGGEARVIRIQARLCASRISDYGVVVAGEGGGLDFSDVDSNALGTV